VVRTIAREEKQEEVISSKKKFCVWEIDNSGNFTYVSSDITDFLGYTYKEMLNKSVFDIIPIENKTKLLELVAHLNKEEESFIHLETILLDKNKKKKKFVLNAFLVTNEGIRTGYSGICYNND
jgi:PAS domain S-box-containing protein